MSFYADSLLFYRILSNLNFLQLLLSIVLIFEDKNCILHLDVRNKIVPGSKMCLLPGIIFVPGTKIRLLPGTKIIPGSKRILPPGIENCSR